MLRGYVRRATLFEDAALTSIKYLTEEEFFLLYRRFIGPPAVRDPGDVLLRFIDRCSLHSVRLRIR